MERLGSFERLAALAERHMRRGAVTNTLLTRAEYGPDLLAGGVTALETEGGLFLLRDRGDHKSLCFLADPEAELPPIPRNTVCEIAFRERDAALRGFIPRLEAAGFEPILFRVRLTRPAGPCAPPEEALSGSVAPGEAEAFLREHFSPLTGCLPGRDALTSDRLLASRDSGGLRGLIHYTLTGKTARICHLAVAERARGRGLASALVRGALADAGGERCTVWTGRENAAALAVYEKAGFSPDGTRSAVLYIK